MSKRARRGVGSGGWITMWREWVVLYAWSVGSLLSVGRRVIGVGTEGVSVRRWIAGGKVRRVVSVYGVCGCVASFCNSKEVRRGIIEVSVSVDGEAEEVEEGRWKMDAMMVDVVVSMFGRQRILCDLVLGFSMRWRSQCIDNLTDKFN